VTQRERRSSGSPELPLFVAHPGLRQALPRHACLAGPTAVEELWLDGVAPGSLFVKRDDRSGRLYGGNKPRKLEFVLGHARARRARRLVTTGGLGTHHGLATTILGRSAGMQTTLVLVHQPVTEAVRHTLLLLAAHGAKLVYGGGVPGTAAGVLRELAGSGLRGERPYLVATGGSSLRGDVGFVNAALELEAQVRAGACPEPAEIYVPVGTGGTLVGLLAGIAVAGLRSKLVGVLVTDILPPSPRSLARAARRLLAWLNRRDPGFPRVYLRPDAFELVRDQLGPGYGCETPAAREALEVARGAGLQLETTYTAKCVAEILARSRRGAPPRGPALFWNTYNGVDLDAQPPAPLDPAALPERFQRLYREPPGV
jgi:D-cysteine desulfhydrase